MPIMQTRRRVLTTLSLAGAAGLLGARQALAAGTGLETTTVRIANLQGICIAPQYVAEELLRAEGFTDVRYVRLAPTQNTPEGIAGGEVDFGTNFASVLVAGLDRGIELTVLCGVHVGCFELSVNDVTRSLAELKGKRVGITFLGSPGHLFLSAMAAHVGIDRRPISAPASRRASRGRSSMAASPRATTMPSRRSTRSLTTNGANTTPRTRSGSTRCACSMSASSSRARRRSSLTALIGVF